MPFVLAEISDRLHTNEPVLSAVFQLHGDGDRGVAGECAARLGLVDCDRAASSAMTCQRLSAASVCL